MAVDNTLKEYSFMEFPLSMARQDAFPLDKTAIFGSLEDAKTYATTDPTAYVGQLLAVVASGTATPYVIKDTKGTLSPLSQEGDMSTHAAVAGSDSTPGHVYLSDAINDTQNAASGKTAATPAAVKAAVTAAEKYADGLFAANDAMVFKGTIGTGGTVTALPTTGYQAGWTYRVITAATYAGVKCEVGDLIIAVKDYATATANSDWTVVQTNIDGAVTGPGSATDAHVAIFSGTTGKVIKDSGFTIKTSVPANAVFTDTKYTHPAHTAATAGLYNITVDGLGHVTATAAPTPVSATQNGVLTSADYNKFTTLYNYYNPYKVATDAEVEAVLDAIFSA